MPCKPLRAVNFDKFITSFELLRHLQAELYELIEIAKETDFTVQEESDQFSRNVLYMKTYFERYERLLENEQQ